jgi:hypothetical protein
MFTVFGIEQKKNCDFLIFDTVKQEDEDFEECDSLHDFVQSTKHIFQISKKNSSKKHPFNSSTLDSSRNILMIYEC